MSFFRFFKGKEESNCDGRGRREPPPPLPRPAARGKKQPQQHLVVKLLLLHQELLAVDRATVEVIEPPPPRPTPPAEEIISLQLPKRKKRTKNAPGRARRASRRLRPGAGPRARCGCRCRRRQACGRASSGLFFSPPFFEKERESRVSFFPSSSLSLPAPEAQGRPRVWLFFFLHVGLLP